MTNQEFSDGFSTLLNSYNTQAIFGEQSSQAEITLDEYEKSVFLTQAQDMIVKQYFDVRTDEVQEGHDGSEIRQMDFSSLITKKEGTRINTGPTTISLGNFETENNGVITINNKLHWEGFTLNIVAPVDSLESNYVTHLYTPTPSLERKEVVVIMKTSWFNSINTDLHNFFNNILSIPADSDMTGAPLISEIFDINIIKEGNWPSEAVVNGMTGDSDIEFNDNGLMFRLPTDILVILNERLVVTTNGKKKEYVVVPLNYREYDRMQSKPYSQPLKKQCWRLFNNIKGFDTLSEVIPIWDVMQHTSDVEYKLRYVRRPQPIVLVNLPDDLEIDGVNVETPCELNKILHMDILNKAFELATATRGGTPGATQARRRRNNTSDNED